MVLLRIAPWHETLTVQINPIGDDEMVKTSKGHYESAARIAADYDGSKGQAVEAAFDRLFNAHSGRDVSGNRTYDSDQWHAAVRAWRARYS